MGAVLFMVVRLPPHNHCLYCEAPIPEDREYCSDECMTSSKVKEKRSSRKTLYFYIAAAAALIALWVLSFVRF